MLRCSRFRILYLCTVLYCNTRATAGDAVGWGWSQLTMVTMTERAAVVKLSLLLQPLRLLGHLCPVQAVSESGAHKTAASSVCGSLVTPPLDKSPLPRLVLISATVAALFPPVHSSLQLSKCHLPPAKPLIHTDAQACACHWSGHKKNAPAP